MSLTKSPIVKVIVKKKTSSLGAVPALKVERKKLSALEFEELQKKPLEELVIIRDQNLQSISEIKAQLASKTQGKKIKRDTKLLKWKLSAELALRKKGMLVNRINPIIKELKNEIRKKQGIRFERIFMDKAREYLSEDMMKKLMDETHVLYEKQVA